MHSVTGACVLTGTGYTLQPAHTSYADLPPKMPLSLLSLPHLYPSLRLLLFREICTHTGIHPTQVSFQTRISAVLALTSQAAPGPA